jgi:hypothetical protein
MINYAMTTKQPRLHRAEPDYYGTALHRVMGPHDSNVKSANLVAGCSRQGCIFWNFASPDTLFFSYEASDRMLSLSPENPYVIWLIKKKVLTGSE